LEPRGHERPSKGTSFRALSRSFKNTGTAILDLGNFGVFWSKEHRRLSPDRGTILHDSFISYPLRVVMKYLKKLVPLAVSGSLSAAIVVLFAVTVTH
jgi:hypothetical protein